MQFIDTRFTNVDHLAVRQNDKNKERRPRVNKEKNYDIKALHEKKHPLSMAYAEINSYYACEKSN